MKSVHETEIFNLIEKAKLAQERAYAPYSKYPVGVCLKGKTGAYYNGANVENSSYGATLCAERVALARAIYEGEREFDAIAVVASSDDICVPCGICLQVLCEFSDGELPIICANTSGKYELYSLSELMPKPFRREV